MVDRHVDQQRLVFEVVAAATRRAGHRVTPEVDLNRVELAEGRAAHNLGDRPRCWKVAVVLADHQDEARFGGHVDELMGGAQRRRERFFDQHVQPGVQRQPRHRHVTRQRRRVQDCVRPGCGDRLLQRFEAHLPADEVQRVGIGVHVADQLDLTDFRKDSSRPVSTVRAEADLQDPKPVHGRQ